MQSSDAINRVATKTYIIIKLLFLRGLRDLRGKNILDNLIRTTRSRRSPEG